MKITLRLKTQQQVDAAFALKSDKNHSSKVTIVTNDSPIVVIEKTCRQALSKIANDYRTLRGCDIVHYVRENSDVMPNSRLPWWKGIDEAISELNGSLETDLAKARTWVSFFKGTHNSSKYPEVKEAVLEKFGNHIRLNERARSASLTSGELNKLKLLEMEIA